MANCCCYARVRAREGDLLCSFFLRKKDLFLFSERLNFFLLPILETKNRLTDREPDSGSRAAADVGANALTQRRVIDGGVAWRGVACRIERQNGMGVSSVAWRGVEQYQWWVRYGNSVSDSVPFFKIVENVMLSIYAKLKRSQPGQWRHGQVDTTRMDAGRLVGTNRE